MSTPNERFIRALSSIEGKAKLGEVASKMLQESPPKLPEEDEEDEAIETTESDDVEKTGASVPLLPHINLFQHPDAHPAVLDILLLQKYGPEWMAWEPETLQIKIPQDFRTQGVSDLNMNKIQAMKTLHFADTPWKRWEVFTWCAMPLNNLFPDFEVMQVPTAAQCLVAIDIFNTTRQDVVWSDELKVYLGTVWKHDGMFCPIEPAGFIEVDKSDVSIDCSKIMEEWPNVRKSNTPPSGESADAEQLRRMLDAHQYLKESRDLFELQLRTVAGV